MINGRWATSKTAGPGIHFILPIGLAFVIASKLHGTLGRTTRRRTTNRRYVCLINSRLLSAQVLIIHAVAFKSDLNGRGCSRPLSKWHIRTTGFSHAPTSPSMAEVLSGYVKTLPSAADTRSIPSRLDHDPITRPIIQLCTATPCDSRAHRRSDSIKFCCRGMYKSPPNKKYSGLMHIVPDRKSVV